MPHLIVLAGALAHLPQQLRKIRQFQRHQMHHVTLALDASFRRHHAGRQDDRSVFLEDVRLDDEFGGASFVRRAPRPFRHAMP